MIFDFNDGWTLTKENGESFSVCLGKTENGAKHRKK